MNLDSIRADVDYAVRQLRGMGINGIAWDRWQRALDAMERVQEALAVPCGDPECPQAAERVEVVPGWTAEEILRREG